MIRHKITILAGIGAIVLLGFGISRLFMLRFQAGDIYPPYSSLRADPLGTKALYDSLDECAGMSARRNYQSLDKADLDPKTTLMFLGDTVAYSPNLDTIPPDIAAKLTKFMRSGGRLVITLLPRNQQLRDSIKKGYEDEPDESAEQDKDGKPHKDKSANKDNDKKETEHKKKASDFEESDEMEHTMPFTNWMQTAFSVSSNQNAAVAFLDQRMSDSALPASLSCYTALSFTNTAPDWKVLYRSKGNPVMIERAVGKGSVLLSTLTFFVSNEGLRKERHPALLARLVGDHREIVFDETHHMIFESPGMLFLYRKYHLRWFAIGLLVLAILFVWQNTANLVPAHSKPAALRNVEIAKGKDSTSGLVNILKRNIPLGSILSVCLAEWKKTADPGARGMKTKMERLQRLSDSQTQRTLRSDETMRIYNEMCLELKLKDESRIQ